MTIEQQIEVLQAAKAGKQIEFRKKGYLSWICFTPEEFSFVDCEYRVKREPRVIYVNEHIGFCDIDRTRNEPNSYDLPKASNLRPVKFVEVVE